ncbi:MAG: hypothetical protein IJZ94_04230 [Clostridia bacterium]|nr:hypothetical protein [Clostridia bacterium]
MKRLHKYKIADLTVDVRHNSSVLLRNGMKYADDSSDKADITIEVSEDRILKALEYNKSFDRDYAEYFVSGMDFYRKLIPHYGFMLHSSCVAVDGKGYLFTADSGVGKSTHTSLWREYLGDRAVMINDDKPAIRYIDNKFMVYGTPWSGKSDESSNESAVVSALVFLERGSCFEIEAIPCDRAVERIIPQMLRYIRPENAAIQFDLLDRFLKTVPSYVMKCTQDIESAKSAWEFLSKNF